MTHRRRLLMALTSGCDWTGVRAIPHRRTADGHDQLAQRVQEVHSGDAMHSLPRCARARASRRTAVPPSRRGVAARSRSTRGERLNRTVRTNERLLSQSKARQGRAAIGPAHRCGCGVAAGSKADRAALRAQYLKNAGQKTFPIVRAQSPTAATSESLVHSHVRASRYASAGAAAVSPDIPPQPGLVHAVGCVC